MSKTTVVNKTKGDLERNLRNAIFGTVDPTDGRVKNGMLARGVKVFDSQMRFTAEALHLLGFRDALKEFQTNGWPAGSNGR